MGRAVAAAIGVLAIACSGSGLFGGDSPNTLGSSASQGETSDDGEGSNGDGTQGGNDDDDPSNSGPGPGEESGSGTTDDLPPPDEPCNGIDDDGDGMVDEGYGELSCGMGACATSVPACEAGVPGECVPLAAGTESCNAIDDDCDGTTDEEVTQSCSTACGDGTETCESGTFVGCNAPQPEAETCDATDQNCDDAIDEGVADCRVGVHRSWHSGSGEHFYTTSITEAQCCGFTLESQDFYFIYLAEHAGLVTWNRCIKANGMHFYTTDGGCEGTTYEGTMGFVATAEIGDSRPLYRSYNGTTGDHFYTTSEAEHNSAVSGDYIDEGVACYVW